MNCGSTRIVGATRIIDDLEQAGPNVPRPTPRNWLQEPSHDTGLLINWAAMFSFFGRLIESLKSSSMRKQKRCQALQIYRNYPHHARDGISNHRF